MVCRCRTPRMYSEELRLKDLNQSVSLRLPDEAYVRMRSQTPEAAKFDPALLQVTALLDAAGLDYQVMFTCGLVLIHAPMRAVTEVLRPLMPQR